MESEAPNRLQGDDPALNAGALSARPERTHSGPSWPSVAGFDIGGASFATGAANSFQGVMMTVKLAAVTLQTVDVSMRNLLNL